jgi:hypothetical protein
MTETDDTTYTILLAQLKGVEREFPHWKLYTDSEDLVYYEGSIVAGAQDMEFMGRIYIRPKLPEVCPNVYIWNPVELPRQPGGTVNEVGCTHAFHTLQNGPDGRVQLCLTRPGEWDATVAHVLLVAKLFLWCEAYCAHLQEGTPIADYFADS